MVEVIPPAMEQQWYNPEDLASLTKAFGASTKGVIGKYINHGLLVPDIRTKSVSLFAAINIPFYLEIVKYIIQIKREYKYESLEVQKALVTAYEQELKKRGIIHIPFGPLVKPPR